MDSKDLDMLLEGVEYKKKELEEGVTPRDLSDMADLVERMGFDNFVLALLDMVQREGAPVQDSEAVADYLREILNLQKPEA